MRGSTKKEHRKEMGLPKGGIEYLLELNAQQSRLFVNQHNLRVQYRATHPTEIAWCKCMDGRVHGPVLTQTPFGIIQPFRSLGGKFDLGWYGFATAVSEWVEYSIGRGRDCLMLVTYHYSRGDKHRGCRGFDYDVDDAIAFTRNLTEQFNQTFGRDGVYAIQVGIETDGDAMVLHRQGGSVIDLSDNFIASTDLFSLLRTIDRDLPERVLADFLPLVKGNIVHASEIRRQKRPLAEAEHKEWVLGVGRGFDWLHEINTALIVGPFDPADLRETIKTAAGLIESNVASRRVASSQDTVLLTSASYWEDAGWKVRLAEAKSRWLNKVSMEVIRDSVPSLLPNLKELTVTVDLKTRRINPLN